MNHKHLILFLILGFLILNRMLGLLDFTFQNIPPDTRTYIDAANLLYQSNLPHATRPLGFALISGIPHLFLSQPTDVQLLSWNISLNILLWLSSALLCFRIVSNYLKPSIAVILCLIVYLSLGIVCHICQFLTEIPILFLFSAIAYFLHKYQKTSTIKFLFYSASILNFGTLIRPGLLYISLFSSLILVLFLVFKHKKKLIQAPAIFLYLSLFGIGLQSYEIQSHYGKFTPSFIDKETWYYYLGSEVQAEILNKPYQEIVTERRTKLKFLPMKYVHLVASQDLKKAIEYYPIITISNWISNIYDNTFSGSSILLELAWTAQSDFKKFLYKGSNIIAKVTNIGMIFLLTLCSGFMLFKKFRFGILPICLIGISLYTILTSGISFSQDDRFHIVLYPIILIAAISSYFKHKNSSHN